MNKKMLMEVHLRNRISKEKWQEMKKKQLSIKIKMCSQMKVMMETNMKLLKKQLL